MCKPQNAITISELPRQGLVLKLVCYLQKASTIYVSRQDGAEQYGRVVSSWILIRHHLISYALLKMFMFLVTVIDTEKMGN